MKKATFVTTALAGVLCFSIAPAAVAHADDAPRGSYVVAAATSDAAENQLSSLNGQISTLQSLNAAVPDGDYSDEVRDLLATAFELRPVIEALIAGRPPAFDFATIPARIELLTDITKTIVDATTNLPNKVAPAHVELGFAVANAVIRVANPASSIEKLEASMRNLADTYARVSQYPDLQPGDVATIYVKARLDKAIWGTRVQRDENILTAKSFEVYNTLNGEITQAVGVWFDAKATVAEVDAAIAQLRSAYDAAAAAPDRA